MFRMTGFRRVDTMALLGYSLLPSNSAFLYDSLRIQKMKYCCIVDIRLLVGPFSVGCHIELVLILLVASVHGIMTKHGAYRVIFVCLEYLMGKPGEKAKIKEKIYKCHMCENLKIYCKKKKRNTYTASSISKRGNRGNCYITFIQHIPQYFTVTLLFF